VATPELPQDLVPDQPPRAEVYSRRTAFRIRVLGVLLVLGALGLLAAAMYPTWLATQNSKRKTEAKIDLKQLGIYCALYEGKYRAYPRSMRVLEDALRKEGVDTAKIFYCAKCGNRVTFLDEVAPSGSYTPRGGATYTWTGTGITDGAPPDLPLAWHRCPLATSNDDMNVLFFQGRVDVFAIGSPSEQALLELEHPLSSPK
jgi:hypothetical protein